MIHYVIPLLNKSKHNFISFYIIGFKCITMWVHFKAQFFLISMNHTD